MKKTALLLLIGLAATSPARAASSQPSAAFSHAAVGNYALEQHRSTATGTLAITTTRKWAKHKTNN